MRRKFVLTGLATVGVATAGMLTAITPVSASTGGVITVVYQIQGNPSWVEVLVNKVAPEFAAKYPGWTIKGEPITNPAENAYYTKLDLMNASASTAPDVMYEDTFLVNSDVTAGYLAPLNSYVSKWSGWKEFSPAAQDAAKSTNGHIYGVSMGTDTRGLYYNKVVFAKAGLPVPWHPTTWAQVLAAAAKIKATEPGVTPMNVYGGTGQGEGSTMQGFEMFLYGTNNWLWDSAHAKWEQAGAGFEAALNEYAQIYHTNNLGPSVQTALGTTTWQTVQQGLMPTNKLGIDLDGSWVVGNLHTRRGQTVAGLYQGPGCSSHAHRERAGPRAREHVGGMAAVGRFTRRQQADGLQLHHSRTGPAELALLRHPRLAGRQPPRCRIGPDLQGAGPDNRSVRDVRPLHPLPPGVLGIPEALDGNPRDHRGSHDRATNPGPGRSGIQQVPHRHRWRL